MLHKFFNYNKHIFPETYKNIGLSVNNSIHAKTVIYRRYKPTSYKKENPRLSAFRRNIVFPVLLYDMNLTKHKEERFLLKIEAQNQGVDYVREVKTINRNGFYFMIPAPSDSTLCAMKLSMKRLPPQILTSNKKILNT